MFCFNDLMALGAIRALLARGYRVPQDVAVIGFDDIEDGQFSTPTLATVAPDKEQIARLALRLLQQRINDGDATQPQEESADFRLVARESTVTPAP